MDGSVKGSRWRRSAPASDADAPRHVGIIMDGNRRWARARGRVPSFGHDAGANHLADVLGWLSVRGVEHVSVYVLSADNIRKRSTGEIQHLFSLIDTVLSKTVERAHDWQLHVSGDTRLLPAPARRSLEQVVQETRGRPRHLTLAIGYSPHEDIATGIRAALHQGIDPASAEFIGAVSGNLPGGPVKEIDLVIRTGNEQRTSGFFPWQSIHSEVIRSRKMWPAFNEADLDRVLAEYRRRRVRAHSER